MRCLRGNHADRFFRKLLGPAGMTLIPLLLGILGRASAAPEISVPIEGGVVGDVRSLDPSFKYAWSASLVETQNHDLVCIWYAGVSEPDTRSGLFYAVKPLGSNAWTATQPLFNDLAACEVNPALLLRTDGGIWCIYRAYVTGHDGARNGVANFTGDLVRISLTYDAATHALSVAGQPEQLLGTNDQPLPMCVETGAAPITTTSGTIVLGVTDKSFGKTGVVRSIDSGAHWTFHEIPRNNRDSGIPAGHSMPAIQQLNDGRLVAYTRSWQYGQRNSPMRDWSREYSFKSVSVDDGVTWSQPTSTPLIAPNARIGWVNLDDDTQIFATNQMFQTKSDTATARKRFDLLRSKDGGVTWINKTIEYDAAGEFGYPQILQASDGFTYVVYGARPTAIKWAKVDSAWFETAPCVLVTASPPSTSPETDTAKPSTQPDRPAR